LDVAGDERRGILEFPDVAVDPGYDAERDGGYRQVLGIQEDRDLRVALPDEGYDISRGEHAVGGLGGEFPVDDDATRMRVREEGMDPVAGGQGFDVREILGFQFFPELPRSPALRGIGMQFVVDDENGKLLQMVHAVIPRAGTLRRSL